MKPSDISKLFAIVCTILFMTYIVINIIIGLGDVAAYNMHTQSILFSNAVDVGIMRYNSHTGQQEVKSGTNWISYYKR